MHQDDFRRKAEELLALADVKINGTRPWDLQVHNNELYSRVLAGGSLELGESYMDGWWDCNKLDEFFCRILQVRLDQKVKPWNAMFDVLKAKLYNHQKPSRAYEVGKRHYDVGNKLYQRMLDKRMIYSCGYWEHASTLDEAQEAKLDLVCRKLQLQPGMHMLDIGCGWGGTAKFAAERYQVKVTGLTISEEQARFAQDSCRGLPVDIKLQDYRSLNMKFDRILSIGMFEHVGYKNYRTFLHVVQHCLKESGLFLLHTIGGNQSVCKTDPWFNRYIFPNSMIPSAKQITTAAEGLFVLEDWHSFGANYDRTLIQWYQNFEKNWNELKGEYDERFFRMWKYYLLASAGSFRARDNQLWQIVFSPKGVTGGYRRPHC